MILLPLLAVVAACWHSFAALHGLWTDWADTTQTHGYLIAAICVWLLWRERLAIRAAVAPVSLWRIWPLGAAMLLWLVAVMAGFQLVEFLLLPLIFWCVMGACYGWRAARASAFPIGFLVMAIPVWGLFNGIFQWSSVYAVRMALRICGIPAYFELNEVHIPEGTFEIAGGCSGLHFVVVGLAIAALMGELRRDRLAERVKLLLLAVGLAMVANWTRIFIIIVAGHLTHMQHYLVARSHYGFGWFVFAVAMAVFFWLESHVAVKKNFPQADDLLATARPVASQWRTTTPAVLSVLGLFALWHLLAVRPATEGIALPVTRGDWSRQEIASGTWRPAVKGADDSRQLLYRRADGVLVDVYLGSYRWQGQGKEFSAYGTDFYPEASPQPDAAQAAADTSFAVQRFKEPGGDEYLVVVTYQIEKMSFGNAGLAQLWYALRAMSQLRSPQSQMLLLRAACHPDCTAAVKVLREWKSQS